MSNFNGCLLTLHYSGLVYTAEVEDDRWLSGCHPRLVLRAQIGIAPRFVFPPLTRHAGPCADTSLPNPTGTVNSKKLTRLNTLTVMVALIRSLIRPRSKKSAETPVKEKADDKGPLSSNAPDLPPKGEMLPPSILQASRSGQDEASGYNSNTWQSQRAPVPASTVKVSKVMEWFRSKSKGRGPADISTLKLRSRSTMRLPQPPSQPRARPLQLLPSTRISSPRRRCICSSHLQRCRPTSPSLTTVSQYAGSRAAAASSTCVCITVRLITRQLRQVRRRKQ